MGDDADSDYDIDTNPEEAAAGQRPGDEMAWYGIALEVPEGKHNGRRIKGEPRYFVPFPSLFELDFICDRISTR